MPDAAEGIDPFFLRSMAMRKLAAAAAPPDDFARLRGARLTDASYGFAGAGYFAGDGMGIEDIVFTVALTAIEAQQAAGRKK